MLVRTLIVFVFAISSAQALCPSYQRVVGRWKAAASDKEMVFRPDQTFAARDGSRSMAGIWKLENSGQLITIATSLPSGQKRVYKCILQIGGDKLVLGTWGMVVVSHGQQTTDPEVHTASTTYERVR